MKFLENILPSSVVKFNKASHNEIGRRTNFGSYDERRVANLLKKNKLSADTIDKFKFWNNLFEVLKVVLIILILCLTFSVNMFIALLIIFVIYFEQYSRFIIFKYILKAKTLNSSK